MEALHNRWCEVEADMDGEWHCLPCPPGHLKIETVKLPGGALWKDTEYIPDNEPQCGESEE